MKADDYQDYEHGLSTLKDVCLSILPLHMPGSVAHGVAECWSSYVFRCVVWSVQSLLMVMALCYGISWWWVVAAMAIGGCISMCYAYVVRKRHNAWQAILDHMSATYDVSIEAATVEVLCVARWRIALALSEPGWPWTLGRIS